MAEGMPERKPSGMHSHLTGSSELLSSWILLDEERDRSGHHLNFKFRNINTADEDVAAAKEDVLGRLTNLNERLSVIRSVHPLVRGERDCVQPAESRCCIYTEAIGNYSHLHHHTGTAQDLSCAASQASMDDAIYNDRFHSCPSSNSHRDSQTPPGSPETPCCRVPRHVRETHFDPSAANTPSTRQNETLLSPNKAFSFNTPLKVDARIDFPKTPPLVLATPEHDQNVFSSEEQGNSAVMGHGITAKPLDHDSESLHRISDKKCTGQTEFSQPGRVVDNLLGLKDLETAPRPRFEKFDNTHRRAQKSRLRKRRERLALRSEATSSDCSIDRVWSWPPSSGTARNNLSFDQSGGSTVAFISTTEGALDVAVTAPAEPENLLASRNAPNASTDNKQNAEASIHAATGALENAHQDWARIIHRAAAEIPSTVSKLLRALSSGCLSKNQAKVARDKLVRLLASTVWLEDAFVRTMDCLPVAEQGRGCCQYTVTLLLSLARSNNFPETVLADSAKELAHQLPRYIFLPEQLEQLREFLRQAIESRLSATRNALGRAKARHASVHAAGDAVEPLEIDNDIKWLVSVGLDVVPAEFGDKWAPVQMDWFLENLMEVVRAAMQHKLGAEDLEVREDGLLDIKADVKKAKGTAVRFRFEPVDTKKCAGNGCELDGAVAAWEEDLLADLDLGSECEDVSDDGDSCG